MSTRRAQYGVTSDTFATHSTWVLALFGGFLSIVSTTKDFCFSHIYTNTFGFDCPLPGGQLLLEFINGFRDDNQVVGVEELLWTAGAELTGKCFHDHYEQERAQDRALVNTHPYVEF